MSGAGSIVSPVEQAPLFVLVFDAPVDQFTPDGLGDSRGQALARRSGEHFRYDVLDSPFKPHLVAPLFDARGRFDVADALGHQAHERSVEAVDLTPHFRHVGAILCENGRGFLILHARGYPATGAREQVAPKPQGPYGKSSIGAPIAFTHQLRYMTFR